MMIYRVRFNNKVTGQVQRNWPDLNHRKFHSSILIWFLVLTLLAGCASLGVRPDFVDYENSKAKETCQSRHGTQTDPLPACVEYETMRRYAAELQEAYESRASINRYAIWVGGIAALASVGALAGLAAFGLAGSDAAKIIPLAGTFVGGSIIFSQSDQKAIAYDQAAMDVADAINETEPSPLSANTGVNDYQQATRNLKSKLNDVHKFVIKKRAEVTSKEFSQLVELQKQNTQLKTSAQYMIKDDIAIDNTPPIPPGKTKIKITLTSVIDLDTVPISKIKVKVGQQDAPVTGVNGSDLQVTVPNPFTPACSPCAVQVFFNDTALKPIKNITLP